MLRLSYFTHRILSSHIIYGYYFFWVHWKDTFWHFKYQKGCAFIFRDVYWTLKHATSFSSGQETAFWWGCCQFNISFWLLVMFCYTPWVSVFLRMDKWYKIYLFNENYGTWDTHNCWICAISLVQDHHVGQVWKIWNNSHIMVYLPPTYGVDVNALPFRFFGEKK